MGISFKQLLTTCCIAIAMSTTARETYNFNSGWTIGKSKKTVTLPRAWNEDDAYKVGIKEMRDSVIWYKKIFTLPENANGKLNFGAVDWKAEVFVNGKQVGLHENGVMAFGFDITNYIKAGKNQIEVRTDNDWNYHERDTKSTYQWNNNNFNANYGGLPKNVWLHITDMVYQTLPLYSNLKTTGVYVYAKDFDISGHAATICVESEVKNETDTPVTKRLTVAVTDRNKEDGTNKICNFASRSKSIRTALLELGIRLPV